MQYTPEDIKKMEEMKKVEAAKKQLLMQSLTKDAFERLARSRLADPRLAMQAEMYILELKKNGRLIRPITDSKLREVLRVISGGEKKEFNIKRK